ncbi:hypothetical protein FIM25_16160 [Desulfobotulus mexicanus]|uniref:Metallopeptidase domain-containing protein n=2 Tax=Desulfobotulus mexicanus TaxID=2586642 RepID=A0A5S5MC89_9BACT|nr:hypothetical protein FIM25_16160 [Desulfobotulus mexicanus]
MPPSELISESSAFLMRKARTHLLLDHPFFGALAMGLEITADPVCGSAWTDGRTIGYQPAYIRALPFESLKGLLAHLVLHTALGHHARRKDRDPSIWNMACDHTMNWMLLEAGFRLPEGWLDDPAFRHLPAETVYERILSRMDEREGQGLSDPGSGENGDGEEMEGKGADGEKVAGDSHSHGSSAGSGEGAGDEGAEGSAEEEKGDPDISDPGGGDPAGTGEVRDGQNPGDASDGEAEASAMETLLAKALLTRRDAGDLPASIERSIREILEPGMDWRMLLSRFVDQTARSDYAWSPPNRRYLHQGLYLPSVRSEDADRIVIVVDTSGSISPGELDMFCAEVSAILSAFSGEILVMGCDMAVGGVFRLTRSDLPMEPLFTGGGGTDFRAPFRWLEKEGLEPRCLIYLTDLACEHYPEDPGFPVLWAVCGDDTKARPPFGECLALGVV